MSMTSVGNGMLTFCTGRPEPLSSVRKDGRTFVTFYTSPGIIFTNEVRDVTDVRLSLRQT